MLRFNYWHIHYMKRSQSPWLHIWFTHVYLTVRLSTILRREERSRLHAKESPGIQRRLLIATWKRSWTTIKSYLHWGLFLTTCLGNCFKVSSFENNDLMLRRISILSISLQCLCRQWPDYSALQQHQCPIRKKEDLIIPFPRKKKNWKTFQSPDICYYCGWQTILKWVPVSGLAEMWQWCY